MVGGLITPISHPPPPKKKDHIEGIRTILMGVDWYPAIFAVWTLLDPLISCLMHIPIAKAPYLKTQPIRSS